MRLLLEKEGGGVMRRKKQKGKEGSYTPNAMAQGHVLRTGGASQPLRRRNACKKCKHGIMYNLSHSLIVLLHNSNIHKQPPKPFFPSSSLFPHILFPRSTSQFPPQTPPSQT
jgi:hypothetical protein